MKKELANLIILIAIILIVLVSFIAYNQWPILTGKRIVLDTRPVDPFDPFRGQFITISYEISQINNTKSFETGDSIYISLKEDEKGVWRLKDTSRSKPEIGDFIKGKVTYSSEDRVSVEYGIEQYFFERNTNLPRSNLTVEVAVSNSGRAKMIRLLHNGQPFEIEYKKFDIRD